MPTEESSKLTEQEQQKQQKYKTAEIVGTSTAEIVETTDSRNCRNSSVGLNVEFNRVRRNNIYQYN